MDIQIELVLAILAAPLSFTCAKSGHGVPGCCDASKSSCESIDGSCRCDVECYDRDDCCVDTISALRCYCKCESDYIEWYGVARYKLKVKTVA